jgi:hypothetical protein
MPKLYEIWRIDLSDRASYAWGKYTNKEFPLIEVIGVIHLMREEIRSMDLEKLTAKCKYLNECGCEDERYEIREVPYDL